MLNSKLLLTAFLALSILYCCAYGTTAQQETGNRNLDYIARIIPLIPSEAPGVQHQAFGGTTGPYEIFALYDDTATGLILDTNKLRRPKHQRTEKNFYVASLYFLYRWISDVAPQNVPKFRELLRDDGLDPDAYSEDLDDPVGVGIFVYHKTVQYVTTDGSNRLGDDEGRQYNRKPYSDTTGYVPVNKPYTPIKDIDPDRWMPLEIKLQGTFGYYAHQIYKSPQLGQMKLYSGMTKEELDRLTPNLLNLYKNDTKAYERQALEVLKESTKINDRRKMISEFFDKKDFGFPILLASVLGDKVTDIKEYMFLQMAANTAFVDGFYAMWHQKTKYDAIRPETAIRYLFDDRMVRAYRGPGNGVGLIKANEWKSYTPSDAFPEYPSGTSCICHLFGAVVEKYLGTKKLPNIGYTFPKGSSLYEPGITPQKDITITWDNLDDLVHDCVQSRLWSGVHFQPAIDATKDVCVRLGNLNYDRVVKLFKGHKFFDQ